MFTLFCYVTCGRKVPTHPSPPSLQFRGERFASSELIQPENGLMQGDCHLRRQSLLAGTNKTCQRGYVWKLASKNCCRIAQVRRQQFVPEGEVE